MSVIICLNNFKSYFSLRDDQLYYKVVADLKLMHNLWWLCCNKCIQIPCILSFIEPNKLYDVLHITLSGLSRISHASASDETNTPGTKPYWLSAWIAAPTNRKENTNLKELFANWMRKSVTEQEQFRSALKKSDLTKADLERIHVCNIPFCRFRLFKLINRDVGFIIRYCWISS